jgi:phage terminase large subunit
VHADCAEPGFISAARSAGYRVMAVRKFPGSINYGIAVLKNYRLHIVKNRFYHEVLKEQSNYKYKQVNGISLDEPIDDFNHFWDAVRYAAMSNLRSIK